MRFGSAPAIMEKLIGSMMFYVEVIGVIALVVVAVVLLRSKVLQQTAAGWKDLAEQREQSIIDLRAEIAQNKAEADMQFAAMQEQIDAQKAEAEQQKLAFEHVLAENKMVKDLNIELQRQTRDMTESNRCLTEEISKLRAENLQLHKELVDFTFQVDKFKLQVEELTRRLHSMGEATREP